MRIDGVGQAPITGHPGYSDYGSLGRYTIAPANPATRNPMNATR